MNSAEAKEILHLYRPDTADADDTEFAEALALTRKDPELARWFENHCASYKTVRAQFKRIEVPAGLKEQILAERPREMRPLPPRRVTRPTLISAVVASVILPLALVLLWLPFRSKNDFSNYRNRMVSTALRVYAMDLQSNDPDKIRSFFAQKSATADYKMPTGLEKLELTGCVVLRWQNRPVSMICFRSGKPLPPGKTSDVFLFVTNEESFSKRDKTGALALTKVNKLTTASWTEDGKNYLLATQGDEEFIRKFVQ